MSSSLVETFKRFDQDGNGLISREELGLVLKELDEDMDNDSVDRLMAWADTSGDGQLFYEEFLRWVFAEDFGATKDVDSFTFVISGCSRSELNGSYVQQDKFSGRRPVFYCAENQRFLFYQKESQSWQIFSKVSKKASARAKTLRAPHAFQGQWDVWKGGDFISEPDMKCEAAALSAEELIANAPDMIYLKTDEVNCELPKFGKLMGGRPCYFNEDGYFVAYFANTQDPEGKDFSGWVVGHKTEQLPLEWSFVTNSYHPHRCLWKNAVQVLAEKPKKAEPAVTNGTPWVDPDFPQSDESIGKGILAKMSSEIKWTRLPELYENPVLFDDSAPFDLEQGCLGNCWLVCLLAAVGEYLSLLKEKIFQTKEISSDGKYKISLFDLASREWETFEVDDSVPCRWGSDPLFVSSRQCMWAPLLEKVFAKCAGSYENLDASKYDWGGIKRAMAMLTGCTNLHRFAHSQKDYDLFRTLRVTAVTTDCDPQSEKKGNLYVFADIWAQEVVGNRMRYKCRFQPPTDKYFQEGTEEGWISTSKQGKKLVRLQRAAGWSYEETELGPEKGWQIALRGEKTVEEVKGMELEDLWQKLLHFDQQKYLISCGLDNQRYQRSDGLVKKHAYTVLRLVEVGDFKMVLCRNPWGKTEWNGPWSDQSDEWQAHPEVAEALQVKTEDFDDDGLFWMEFSDFSSVMWRIHAAGPLDFT